MGEFKITDDIFNLKEVHEWLQDCGVDEETIKQSFYDKGWGKEYDEIVK